MQEAEVSVVREKVSRIRVPINISEQSQISGFAFSKRLLNAANLSKMRVPKSVAEGTRAFQYASLARRIASDSDGGPTVGENWIKIWIAGEDVHRNAGSEANYIWMYFGPDKRIKLWGVSRTRFPADWTLSWDLNEASSFLETIPTDAWDDIALVTESGDGMLINRIQIKHSSVTILYWRPRNLWLDGSRGEAYGKVGLAAPMLSCKLGKVRNSWVPQIHWAARELGKSDGKKYDSTDAWCSEFARWCLEKSLWDTGTTGEIGSRTMEDYFSGLGRMHTQTEILHGDYVLTEGDYLRFEWSDGGHHSALFIRYRDDSRSPTTGTRIVTIEGNTGSTVAVRNRTLEPLLSVGSTR